MKPRAQGSFSLGTINPVSISAEQNDILLMDRQRDLEVGDKYKAGGHYLYNLSRDGYDEYYDYHLKTELVFQGYLDPLSMPHDQSQKILRLFARAKELGFLSSGLVTLESTLSGKETSVDVYFLEYTISARKKGQHFVFDIIDDTPCHLVGSGSQGKICKLLGTWKMAHGINNARYFSPGLSKRVTKLQIGDNELLQYEYKFTESTKTFHARDYKELNIGGRDRSLFTMKRFPGDNLETLLVRDARNPFLKVIDRISLCVGILRDLQRLHRARVLHRDIKPSNVLANRTPYTRFWTVKIIDLGLSSSTINPPKKLCGTPLFIAPEVYLAQAEEKTDVYGAARVLGVVWRDSELDLYNNMRHDVFFPIRLQQENVKFVICEGVALSDSIKATLLSVLDSMTVKNINARITLEKSIEIFEQLRLDVYLEHASTDVHDDIKFNYNLALGVIEHCHALADVKSSFQFILQSVRGLRESDVAIDLFIDVLGLTCLHGCRTKQDLLNTMDLIMDDYTRLRNELHDVHAQLQALQAHKQNEGLASYLEDVQGYKAKSEKVVCNLDEVAHISQYLHNKIKEMRVALNANKQEVDSARPIAKSW